MQVNDRIIAIERRTRRLNLTLASVCGLAEVDYSTVWRWKAAKTQPLISTFDAVTGKLETTLSRLEREMREKLDKSA